LYFEDLVGKQSVCLVVDVGRSLRRGRFDQAGALPWTTDVHLSPEREVKANGETDL